MNFLKFFKKTSPITIALIPSRYGSSRFPGKPLVPILGKSLLQRAYESAKACKELEEVYVATDDERIFSHVEAFGGKAIDTSSSCANGTERIAEALQKTKELSSVEIIVNIQGDQPCISSDTIRETLRALKKNPSVGMATAAYPFSSWEEMQSPHKVKCLCDVRNKALYFSRSPLPYSKSKENFSNVYHHVGIYAFRKEFLLLYAKLKNTPLQESEDLEQLKALEHGFAIQVALVKEGALGVDTPEDIKEVEKFLCP